MSIDDIVTRHRPEARLDRRERERMLATLGLSTEPRPVDGVIPLADLREQAPRAPRPRRTRVPAVAAAVVALLCAGGLAAWRLTGGSNSTAPASGSGPAVCAGTLPASWDAARSAIPLRVDGHDAVPQAAAPNGTQLLSWNPTPTTVAFGLRATDGTVTPVATFPGQDLDATGTDGRRVVVGLGQRGTDTTDVQLIDSITHSRLHLLPAAPMPAGWVVRTDVAILDGYVYWGATPRGDDHRGVVIRYSVADRSYRVLATLDRFPTVESDIRGVAWPTGSVRRPGLPRALNPILDAAGDPVDRLVTDGGTYAWQQIDGDQTIFHWADGSGDTRTFRVAIELQHDGAMLTGVSGRFLFFHVNKARGTESVLDTRTGALAPAPRDEEVFSAAGGHVFAMAGAAEYHAIDAAALRGFACR